MQKRTLATSVGIQPDAVSVCALTHITKGWVHLLSGEGVFTSTNRRDQKPMWKSKRSIMDIEVFLKINGFIGERGQVME
jgi:hypothetical protein